MKPKIISIETLFDKLNNLIIKIKQILYKIILKEKKKKWKKLFYYLIIFKNKYIYIIFIKAKMKKVILLFNNI